MATTLSPVRAGAKDAPAGSEVVPEKKKKGGKKKLVIILVVVLLAAGVGYKLTLGKSKATGPAKPKPGAVVKLESVSLNLSGGHYLKLGIALQTTTKAKSDLDGSEATDIAISEFSGMSMDTLAVPAKREEAKKEYLDKLEKAYPDEIMDIYFTEFVMQ
ncbi:MAG: flagellar basal body-associated FliL family protein [Actinomycetales bacterium]